MRAFKALTAMTVCNQRAHVSTCPNLNLAKSNAALQAVGCSPRLPRNKKVNTNPATNPPMCAM
jgi:hypothetical protein